MAQEYWKWPESGWTSERLDWRKAKTVTAGVDIGTTSSQAAVMCDNELFAYASIYTGPDFRKAAETVIEQAIGPSGMSIENISGIVATGWGSRNVSCAGKTEDEVLCHAMGARFLFGPEVRTVVDLGGQTIKAIRLYDWDRVRDFIVSDKCATGMGRSTELMAELLQVPITEMGERSLQVEKDPEPVSTTCYNFANPEAIGLFRPGYKEPPYSGNDVLASYLFAIAWRVLGTMGKLQPLDAGETEVYRELGFTGGLAKNPGVTKRIERELKVTALDGKYDPQLAGAIGAALLA